MNLKFLLASFFLVAQLNAQTIRDRWVEELDKVARPVLENLAQDQLKAEMPVELSAHIDNPDSRKQVAYLEAVGRTISGISPWLMSEGGSEKEIALREKYKQWTVAGIRNAVNPKAKDYLLWDGGQPLVDASFFALGLVRCPWIWENLDQETKAMTVAALNQSQHIVPVYSNWILFSAMIEAFYAQNDLTYDPVRIEYGIREFTEHWNVGDGLFSDGNSFAMDYYNSYVIHPYLSAIVEVMSKKTRRYDKQIEKITEMGQRYAQIQERSIAPDGTYPLYGRSIVYRGGAFQHLADAALREKLPSSISPSQVRSALTAVLEKTLACPDTYNDQGWLNIGVCGYQPGIADFYITTGSLYLCANIFLPLGLNADHDFWTTQEEPWTSKKVFEGIDVPGDHALHK
ncbi:DUF2264 domain-containing protein [Jiulongibacter sediminis]|jgi:hypothetical protein|uniref:DUF2264 domain-containing protein n=1 Tax=Jiulongibacter sediminis TaxID=1605367 RepID=UPI0026E9BFE8|nr:DUF2264 domain-containing protein [Jiulongibacter sediminis]